MHDLRKQFGVHDFMKNLTEKQMKYYENHRKPVTRRDFLSQGLISGAAFTMLPGLGSLLYSKSALAQTIGPKLDPNMIPFMVFDMAGGAALPGNFLVGGRGGPDDLLRSYDALGWDPRANGAVDRRFGLPMAAQLSGLFQGITQTASADAMARLRMGSFCHSADFDTQNNQLSAIALIAQAGYQGELVQKIVTAVTGTSPNSRSGGNSDVASMLPPPTPLVVSRVNDLLNSVSFGTAFDGLPVGSLNRLATHSLNVALYQILNLPNNEQGRKLAQLSEESYRRSSALVESTTGLDPRIDQAVLETYGINNGTGDADDLAVEAAVVMNTIKGQSGPGCVTLGGCDYHDGTATTGDAKDRTMGQKIGRAVQLAHRLQKPLMFQLITDGGCENNPGTRNWTGDTPGKCMTVLGYYRPEGAPTYRMDGTRPRIQVGNYTSGQIADSSHVIGSEPFKVAYAVLANYLSAIGRLGEFERLAPSGLFTPAQLESLLIYG
jgi:hypothetical protein